MYAGLSFFGMWFLISIFVVLWLIGLITFGARAYGIHALLAAAVVLGLWNAFRKLRA